MDKGCKREMRWNTGTDQLLNLKDERLRVNMTLKDVFSS